MGIVVGVQVTQCSRRIIFLFAVLLSFCVYGLLYCISGSDPVKASRVGMVVKIIQSPQQKQLISGHGNQKDGLATICVAITVYDVDWLQTFGEVYGPLTHNEADHSITEVCRHHCIRRDKRYAILFGGDCWCLDVIPALYFVEMSQCHEKSTVEFYIEDLNSTSPSALLMRTRQISTSTQWSTWMSIPDLNIQSRYRHCEITRGEKASYDCMPELRYRMIIPTGSIGPNFFYIKKKLIGCFTGDFLRLNQHVASSKVVQPDVNGYIACSMFCKSKVAFYAAVTSNKQGDRQCYCTNTLARTQPSDTCTGEVGMAVFWTADTPIRLKFEAAKAKKGKVLVIGRYRSGSSMTQSFFVRYPNALTFFEPEKYRVQDGRTTDDTLSQMLKAAYQCNIDELPPSFFTWSYLQWNNLMLSERGATVNPLELVHDCSISVTHNMDLIQRSDCRRLVGKPDVDCSPLLKEICEEADFINMKTIRFLDRKAIKEFIIENPDVHVVHLVRDPRGLLSAQDSIGENSMFHDVCKTLVDIGKLVQEMKSLGYKNIHEVFYEELATNSSYFGDLLYKEMNIVMPAEVSSFLRREGYKQGEIPEDVMEVIMDNPEEHVYGFLQRYPLSVILEIDDACSDVYDLWKGRYSTLWELYNTHPSQVMKYSSEEMKQDIKYLISLNSSFIV